MEAKKNISFRLLNIVTEQFATFDVQNISDKNDLQSDIQFSINPLQRVVACRMKFQFIHEKQPIVVLTVVCNFDVEEKSWRENILSEKKVTLPRLFLEHICMITLGTSRGVLHAKTENTFFNRFVIPLLNVNNLVEKEVVFEIN